MPAFAARTDPNQKDIVKRLRALGCTCVLLHTVGRGVPDLIVGLKVPRFGRFAFLMEVKNPLQKAKELKPDQRRFFRTWRGPAVVCETPDEAEHLVNALRAGDFLALYRSPFLERLPPDMIEAAR